jgi:CDP-diglyceride synthetase
MSESPYPNIFNIRTIVAIGSTLLAFAAFTISYDAMSKLAKFYSIEPSGIFPLIIDGVLLLALIWRMTDINTFYAQLTMFSYIIISMILNYYANPSLSGGLIAMLAPFSLFVTSEICASIYLNKSKQIKQSFNETPRSKPLRDEHGRFIKKP